MKKPLQTLLAALALAPALAWSHGPAPRVEAGIYPVRPAVRVSVPAPHVAPAVALAALGLGLATVAVHAAPVRTVVVEREGYRHGWRHERRHWHGRGHRHGHYGRYDRHGRYCD